MVPPIDGGVSCHERYVTVDVSVNRQYVGRMTIKDDGETPSRTAAATAAKMRKSEERWAQHLRDRGWAVIDPEHAGALLLLVDWYAQGAEGMEPIPHAQVWTQLGMTGEPGPVA